MKKITDMRMAIAFIVAIVFIMFSLYGWKLLLGRDTVVEDSPQQTDDFGAGNVILPTATTTPETEMNQDRYLSAFDIHPLYAAFLRDEISVVENPYAGYNAELSFFDDREIYEGSFRKSFSLVDVNHDNAPELVFRMTDSPSDVVYILGVQDDQLICYGIEETHTMHMGFSIYDNGIVTWGQNYNGEEERYYTFTEDGKEHELIHFVRDAGSDSDLYYDYYYLEGNKESWFSLQDNEAYESLVSSYQGEEPEWFDCEDFADIPKIK